MRTGKPSSTARSMALVRAAHIDKEQGSIFRDEYAHSLSRDDHGSFLHFMAGTGLARPLRFVVAARCRFAEERLRESVAKGLRQAVMLGAGFDSFGLRNPLAAQGLHVFEVDHPDTQRHKLERLAKANVAPPSSVTLVPVNFEKDDLEDMLAKNGFKKDEPAFFIWLGVVPYLNIEAIRKTLSFVASAPSAELILDYMESALTYKASWWERVKINSFIFYASLVGEPFITTFAPEQIAQELRGAGFTTIEDLHPQDIYQRLCAPYLSKTYKTASIACAHLLYAKKDG